MDNITSADGDDIILGDFGAIILGDSSGTIRNISQIYSLYYDEGGADEISTGNGENVAIGGLGGDRILAGSGRDILVGSRRVSFVTATAASNIVSFLTD